MKSRSVERIADLTEVGTNRIYNMTLAEARARLASGGAAAAAGIQGSFALVARQGEMVRMARSIDRPLRYFLAKRADGPMLVAAHRIDAIRDFLVAEELGEQFHPSYTRMVPAHWVVDIRLVGCPDPDPSYSRFFTPQRGTLPPDTGVIGRAYVSALAEEIAQWLRTIPPAEPVGVCFSGGIDSGSVFLVTLHVMRELGMSPARLKVFTLSAGGGADLEQARKFLEHLDLGMFLEAIEIETEADDIDPIDPYEAVRVIEDYKRLDVESAAMALALCRGIRKRYPDWLYLLDGDGGDENLKDYPIEENPELTIRSVLNNSLLYQEGWGVGTIKHSLVYSGGQSRSYTRNWAPLRHCGFDGFSPYTQRSVIEVAEDIPFVALTDWSHERLYELKGEIVARGVEALTGMKMPVFPKRRFQAGVHPEGSLPVFPVAGEAAYRREFLSLYV